MHSEKFTPLQITWIHNTVFDHLKTKCEEFAYKIAITDDSRSITYLELLNRINILLEEINKYSNHKEPVIILHENNIDFICSMLACLASGKGYIPVDIDFAEERNKQIITQSLSKLIISSSHYLSKYNLDESYQIINLDTLKNQPNYPTTTISTCKPEDVAYVIYTSGSTGLPKGVYQNQQNMLHDVMQYINILHINQDDHLSLLYSPSVNGAIRDIYGSILTGATLHIHNLQKHGLASLSNFIADKKITIYHSIPSIFRTGLRDSIPETFSTIRYIYLAGDKILKSDIDIYKQKFPTNCKVYIGIGSTENATIYRQWIIDKNTELKEGIVPVGFEVQDRNMRLLDSTGEEVKNQELGEIHVTSKYCALGYWKDQELTHQHFIFNEDGTRTVKTGDWGLINQDGLLEFRGRKDSQLKINGFRVELTEIETIIRDSELVNDVVVIVREKTNKIIAFVELSNNKTIEDIKRELSFVLPKHMYPNYVFELENIPYLGNFKVDYKKIRSIDNELYLKEIQEKENIDRTKNDLTNRILNHWSKYLSVDSFNKNETWKFSGGSSIDILHFIFDIENEFKIDFPNHLINESITPSFIEHTITTTQNSIQNLNKQNNKPLKFYVFPPIEGLTLESRNLLSELNKIHEIKIIEYKNLNTNKDSEINNKIIAQKIDKKTFETDENFVFLGFCSGDQIAYRIISEMDEKKQQNCLFIIIDSAIHNDTPLFSKTILHIKNQGFLATIKRGITFLLEIQNFKRKTKKSPTENKIGLKNSHTDYKKSISHSYLIISNDVKNPEKELGWKPYLQNLKSEKINCSHKEMFSDSSFRKKLISMIAKEITYFQLLK